jgi:hypothetical protein
MDPIEILLAVLGLAVSAFGVAVAFASFRYQQANAPANGLRKREEPGSPLRSPPDHHKTTNDGEKLEGRPATRHSGTRSQRWQRELIDVGIAAAATVGVGLLIRATPWGNCGTCDDVLEFGRYPLADIVVVLVCIFVVRAILRSSATQGRAFLGVAGVLALLAVYGLMWLATVVWGGTLDPRTVQSVPGIPYDPRNAIWVGGYSDFDPTLRTVVMASVLVALSNLSPWIKAQPSID